MPATIASARALDDGTPDLGRVLLGGRFDRASHLPPALVRRLPPAPRNQRTLPGDSWQAIGSYINAWVVIAALAMLLAVVVAVFVLVQLPALRVTGWSLLHGLVESTAEGHLHAADFYPSPDRGEGESAGGGVSARALITVVLLVLAVCFFRRIPGAALWEEQAFRQGSERWSARERMRSAHVFGWAHFMNLVYPIATVYALVAGGWLFTACYLLEYRASRDSEAATYRATALHSVYNALAGTLVLGALLVGTWMSV